MPSSRSQSAKWNGVERRTATRDRRQVNNRRGARERRLDKRVGSGSKQQMSLLDRFRKLTRPRLGVDRRKGSDRRIMGDRRKSCPAALLTREELAALLE